MVNTIKHFLVVVSVFILAQTASAQPMARYQPGIHYEVLSQPVATADPTKIEVVEVFWYGCSHCYNFEPSVVKWEATKPEDVNFVRMPAIWNATMAVHARAFYVAQALGVIDKVHQALFNAMHIDRKRLRNAEEIAEIFEPFGVSKEDTIKTFDAFGTTSALQLADSKARSYGVDATPQLVIDGRYRVGTNQNLPQTELFAVVDFLVDKARREKDKPEFSEN